MPDSFDRHHVLLDPRLVERTENAALVPGIAVKEPRNPLFVEDRPWEVRFDNLYANVHRDESTGVWRCWYNPFIVDALTSDSTPVARAANRYTGGPEREMGLCYAESRDGISWEKPALGICDFAGSRANNLVLRDIHGAGVTFDPVDPDPARRYKAFMTGGAGISPDGLRWERYACPEIEAAGDTHNIAVWDAAASRYVGFTRLWDRGQRIVGRTESADFRSWTRAVEVLCHHPDEPGRQTYAHLPFRWGDGWLALVMLLDTATDLVDCELAWSADTIRWERICRRVPIVARGPAGAWDWGCIYGAAFPIVTEDGIRVYYGGSDDTHMSWRKAGFGLARLRPWGFAGFAPVDKTRAATIVTAPVTVDGQRLRITTDAHGGEVRAGILDADGFALDRCDPITGDVTDAVVSWSGRDDLGTLAGKKVRIAFEIRDARVYAFDFA